MVFPVEILVQKASSLIETQELAASWRDLFDIHKQLRHYYYLSRSTVVP